MIRFATLLTVLPVADGDHRRLAEKVAERDTQLYAHGRDGYRHASTVTVTGTEFVTVMDTLTREDALTREDDR